MSLFFLGGELDWDDDEVAELAALSLLTTSTSSSLNSAAQPVRSSRGSMKPMSGSSQATLSAVRGRSISLSAAADAAVTKGENLSRSICLSSLSSFGLSKSGDNEAKTRFSRI